MGTFAEKILSKAAGKKVSAGETVIAHVDISFVQDGTGPLAVRQLRDIGREEVENPDKTFVFLDHASPSPNKELSNDHILLREFAEETGAHLYDIGRGICHQLINQNHTCPWNVVVGADSHTCTGGALGAFATGMGSTDVAIAMLLGETWFRVPEAFLFNFTERFEKGVYGKDLILNIMGDIGSDGATYKSMEFTGPGVENLPVSERMTISNMVVEAGAKTGIFPSDKYTKNFLKKWGRENCFREMEVDDEGFYGKKFDYSLKDLEPQIAAPHTVDNVYPVNDSKVKGVKIHQTFLGSCTNARFDDLKVAASILKNEEVHKDTRLIINPASREIYKKAISEGLIDIFIDAGGVVDPPGCGVCYGGHQGVLGNGENALGSNNRNFKGRFGNPEANVYLGSPASVAAAAVEGKIVDPREKISRKN